MNVNLGNIGEVTVKIDFTVTSAAYLSAALILPILVFFICKKLV